MYFPEGQGTAEISVSTMFLCHFDTSNYVLSSCPPLKKVPEIFCSDFKILFLLVHFPMIA